MKKKRIIVVSLRIIAGLVIAYFGWVLYFFYISSNLNISVTTGEGDSDSISGDFSPLDSAIANIDDSLPYYQYRKIKDSLEHIKETNKYKNAFSTTGMGTERYGIYEMPKHDSSYYSPASPLHPDPKITDKDYYLMIGCYTLNMDKTFFRDKGKNYLKYPVWDKIEKTKKGNTKRSGHYEIKEINVTAEELAKKDNFNQNEKRNVYLPISKKTHGLLDLIFKVYWVVTAAWSIYIIFLLPIKILERIAKGDAFNIKNIRALYIISFSLIGFYLLYIIIPIIIFWCTKNSVPSEFKFSWPDIFTDQIKSLFIGLIVLIIARTFTKGYRLQTEQELTV